MIGPHGVNCGISINLNSELFHVLETKFSKDSPDTAKNVIFRGGTITRPHRNNLRIAMNLIYF